MILGIGVDICDIDRIKKLNEKYGDKFAHKILTETEFEQYSSRKYADKFLATRFAAKEAAVKALGTGFTNGLWFNHIEITNQASGKPNLQFLEKAHDASLELNVKHCHLSLSDEKEHVVAMVVLEK